MTHTRKVTRILIEIGAMLLLAFGINFVIQEPYLQGIVLNGILFSIVALGLQLIMGYAGQISLGQAAFVGLGAYTSVLMTKAGISFWLALPVAGFVAGLGGVLMSPIVRLAGGIRPTRSRTDPAGARRHPAERSGEGRPPPR